MTEQNGRQQGLGKTGGLPGAHADPRTRRLPADQLDDTVAMGDVAPVEEPAGEPDDRDERGGAR